MKNAIPQRFAALALSTFLASAGLVAVAAPAAAATTYTVCASGCTHTTIQSAVNAAVAGDTVEIAAGTYSGSVTVSKGITLVGAGSGTDPATSTILQGSGSGTGIAITGTSDNPAKVQDLRITGFTSGITTTGYLTIDGVASVSHANYGIALNNGTTNLTIIDSQFNNNGAGMKIGSKNAASNITISGSEFNDNSGQGWYSDIDATVRPPLDGVTITDSSFNNNADKGFYTERLSNATFSNVEFNNNGFQPKVQGAGLDLNLKYAAYSDIEIEDITVIDSGPLGTPQGYGVSIAARNDGNYAANPATLQEVWMDGGTVHGSYIGVYAFGNITDGLAIRDFDLSGNGLALLNASVEEVYATYNWWGIVGPDFSAQVQGDAVLDPWWADAAMTTMGFGATSDDPVLIPGNEPVAVIVDSSVEDPIVDVTELMVDSGQMLVTQPLTMSTTDGVSLELAVGTLVTASDDTWDALFIPPTVVTVPAPTTPDGLATKVQIAIKVGSDDIRFTLDKAARIVLPGAAGQQAGFIEPGGVFTPITQTCAADSQLAGDAADGECSIVVGDDLVIWTKHFTTFLAYLPTLANSGAETGAWPFVGLALVLVGVVALVVTAIRRRAINR